MPVTDDVLSCIGRATRSKKALDTKRNVKSVMQRNRQEKPGNFVEFRRVGILKLH